MPQRLSLRPLLLLFLGPLLQNAIVMTWLNLMTFKSTTAGYQPNLLCYIGICQAFGYTVSSNIAGRWVTVARANWLFAGAVIGTALIGLAIDLLPPIAPYMILSVIFGLCNGQYFVPFQVGMSSVKPFRTLAWTIAFYNVSWGTGLAIGPFLAGSLKGASTTTFIVLATGLAAVHTILVLLAASAKRTDVPTGDANAPGTPLEQPVPLFYSTRRLRTLGYMCSFVGQFLLAALSISLWPPLARDRGLSPFQMGLGLAIMGIQIPIGAIVFGSLRRFVNRPWMLLTLLLLGATMFQMLPLVAWPWHLVVLGLVGFACSGLFFHGVYYPNADPETPHRSVGIMETCVGIAGVIGPLLLGNLAGNDATQHWPYLVGSVIIGGIILIALRVWFNGEAAAPAPA